MPEVIMIPFRLSFGLSIFLGPPWILGFMAGRPGRFWVLSFIFFLGAVLFPPIVVMAMAFGVPAECGMLAASAVVTSPFLALFGFCIATSGFRLARSNGPRDEEASDATAAQGAIVGGGVRQNSDVTDLP